MQPTGGGVMRIVAQPIAIALLACAPAIGAQVAEPAENLAIGLTLAEHLRDHAGFSNIALDPRDWNDSVAGGVGRERSAAESAALAAALGATVRRREDVLFCPEGPGSCQLRDAGVHLFLGSPVVSGDSATVAVVVYYRAGPAGSVAYSRSSYTLVRTRAAWKVARRTTLVVSGSSGRAAFGDSLVRLR